jgi:hypothetical protein
MEETMPGDLLALVEAAPPSTPAVSPHNPNVVFVSCDMTGSYSTTNGGLSWRMFTLHGVIHNYVFDLLDSTIVYAL